jgi:hypothetical protein
MCTLLNASQKNRAGAYLKCILHSYQEMEGSDNKWISLAAFLSSIRGCQAGQESAIEEIYFDLPPQSRLKDKVDDSWVKASNTKALQILSNSLQRISMNLFSDGSLFVKKVCGVHEKNDVLQASHQVQALRGLIGNKVGLPSQLKFDLNAELIYKSILKTSSQDLIKEYYQIIDFPVFTLLLKNIINEEIISRSQQDKGLYPSFMQLFDDEVHECMEIKYHSVNGADAELQVLTNKGVTSLLKRSRIIEENDNALPW